MTERENYLRTLRQEAAPWVPVYERPVLVQRGFMDPFEKGPEGGGYDGFGILWIPTESADGAVVPAANSAVLEEISQWREKIVFPDLEKIDWKAKAAKELEGIDREQVVLEYGMGNAHFERLAALMGFENALCALYEEPEECRNFFEAFTDYRIRLIDKIHEYYAPDTICSYDDVATERSLFMSPETYRAVIGPFHKKVNDAIRAKGALPIQHCCGRAEAIIQDFIDEGAVAWTSVQPCNDIARLIQTYGKQITLIGGFDSNGYPGGTEAAMEERIAEIHRAIDDYAGSGSFILGNINIMTGKGAAETEQIMDVLLEEARNYGKAFGERHSENMHA